MRCGSLLVRMVEDKHYAVFRLEFGGERGWGHLVRCAALAEELQRRDWMCGLWTSGSLAGLPAELGRAFSRVVALAPDWAANPPPEVIAANQCIIDLYDFSDDELENFQGRLRSESGENAPRVLVIDDEATRSLAGADLILNARLGLANSPYAPQTRALLGERYALLRSGLRGPADATISFSSRAMPVLIMFGGTDPAQMTAVTLNALADVDTEKFVPIVVRSRFQEGKQAVAEALLRFAEFQQVEGLNAAALAGWARHCKFAITAAGGSAYELAFLGLPFVSVVVAANQREQARAMDRHWQMPVVDVQKEHRFAISGAVRRLLAGISREAILAIDGKGAARVADAIEKSESAA